MGGHRPCVTLGAYRCGDTLGRNRPLQVRRIDRVKDWLKGSAVAINWRTDYAIRLMCEIAKLGSGERDTVRRTADTVSVPYDYARTIARDLVSAGLLKSRRGVGGGIELARPAEDISILDVMKAMDDQASLSLCTADPSICGRSDTCAVHVGVWRGLDVLIEGYLSQHTLADAVELGGQLERSLAQEADLAF